MLAKNAATKMPPGEKQSVVSPLGVVPKRGTNTVRLTVNVRYLNRHLEKDLQVRRTPGPSGPGGEGGPRGALRLDVGVLPRGTPPKVEDLRWIQL